MQVRTGPDGCLWVVDMYRFVIEHPRWIPPEDLAKLDVRAGATMGRIYRIRPRDREPRPMPRLDKLDTAGLVAALDSPNGWQRDLAGQLLLWKNETNAAEPLARLAATSSRPETRLHALVVLDGLGKLTPAMVQQALADAHPGVRRVAVRLARGTFRKRSWTTAHGGSLVPTPTHRSGCNWPTPWANGLILGLEKHWEQWHPERRGSLPGIGTAQ